MSRTATPAGGRRLRFRWELLHAAGLEAVSADGSRGVVESVEVGPFEFWAESLVLRRSEGCVRIPAGAVQAVEPGKRVLLGPPDDDPRRVGHRRSRGTVLLRRLEVGV
jgi:hypothetical protein